MCEEEPNKNIRPEKDRSIKALITFYHQLKPLDEMSQEEVVAFRYSAVLELFKYLPFIPIGQSQGNIIYDPKGRLRLLEERGKRCEICTSDLANKPFELHHMNYFKSEDPQYQKILCPPCHESIGYVHGLVKIFEDKLGDFPLPPLFIRLASGEIIMKREDIDEE